MKIFLRIKFKLDKTHKGQSINEKNMWTEIQKLRVSQENWADFICKEMEFPEKYSDKKRKY